MENKHPRRRSLPLKGPEPWKKVGRTNFCQWDRWFLALLVGEHDGDWEGLRRDLRAEGNRFVSFEGDREAKLSHLADLRRRVEHCGLVPDDVIGHEARDKRVLKKARTKVLEQELKDRYKTQAMRDTPRRRLSQRALRGSWSGFPISPARFEYLFAEIVEARSFFSERASFGLSDRLEARLNREARRRSLKVAGRLALYRAFLTVGLEAMDRTDDSGGMLAETYGNALETYFELSQKRTGIKPEVFYLDIMEFCVWEDYGLTDGRLGPLFAAVSANHVDLVEGILRELRQELQSFDLNYQAEQALTLIGRLHVAQQSFDRFVELAREMGARQWQRITTMAEAAWQARRRKLALDVFKAADQEGFHRDFLRKRCRKLTGKTPGQSGQP